MTNRGSLAFMVLEGRFTAAVFIGFLRRLLRQAGGKVGFIVHEHLVHVAAAAERWVARHAKRIRLYFLPGYSSELNPSELLNRAVKINAVRHQRAHHLAKLMGNVRRSLLSG